MIQLKPSHAVETTATRPVLETLYISRVDEPVLVDENEIVKVQTPT